MHPTRTSTAHQQNRIAARRDNSTRYSFFNLLTSDALLHKVEDLLPDHRERLYPPTETLSMFLAQVMNSDRSCQNIVNEAAVQRISNGFTGLSVRTGGYCRARQRLPLSMISHLSGHLAHLIDDQTPACWHWKGRKIRLVDGTTVTMPDTQANQKVFPQQRGQKPGLGFPICRIVGITCLASGALLNAAIGRFNGKGSDEQTLLRTVQDNLLPGEIVLGDAFFATYFFIAEMQRKGVDILMEQHGARRRSTDFRKGKKLGERDHLIELKKPIVRPNWMSEERYAAEPESIIVRECKVGRKVLVTTLSNPKSASKAELKSLYKRRWNVELDIRNIKDTMGMNILSCKTPEMALKEIWIYFLAYNLIRLMMAQSALLADITPRDISFKHSLQLWLIYSHQATLCDDDQLYQFFLLLSQQQVGKRPGRIEPRAVKRRPKAFPLLTKTRGQARTKVLKNGHPKKLK